MDTLLKSPELPILCGGWFMGTLCVMLVLWVESCLRECFRYCSNWFAMWCSRIQAEWKVAV